jgi:tripartite ATP-independent transporter DctM subunit
MMETTVLAILLFAALLGILSLGVWIAFALLAVAIIAVTLFAPVAAGQIMALTIWGSSGSWSLVAMPMFLWMGEILFRTRLSEDMFRGLAPLVTRIPGRLMHINVLGCGIMAAVVGSSSVTCATIGRISLPELRKRGYDEGMAVGTLAGSGTMGLLIPPSIMMIVYGVVAQVSIARMFVAGVLPGLMMIGLFMCYVAGWSLLFPDRTPRDSIIMTLRERLYAARRLFPVLVLIVGVMGSIYAGVATPTEAAVIGVVGALLISFLSRTLTWETFKKSVIGATCTSCMIMFILTAAAFLSVAVGYAGIPQALAQWVSSLNLSIYTLILVLTIVYIILGSFLDGASMIVLTISVVQPMVVAAGIDLVWFGIYLIIVIEMAQITPPVGFNLFVLQALTGRDMMSVATSAMPFFLLMLVAVVLLVAFPDIALYLPQTMYAH